jgi:hypothetical protein
MVRACCSTTFHIAASAGIGSVGCRDLNIIWPELLDSEIGNSVTDWWKCKSYNSTHLHVKREQCLVVLRHTAHVCKRFSDGEARRTGETSAAVAALPRPSDSDSEAPSKCWTEQQFAALGHRLLLGRIGQRVLGGVLRPARLVAELQSRRPTSLPSLLPLLWHSLAITHAPSGLWGLTSRPSAARLAAASGRSHLTAPRSGGTCVGSQV